LPADYGMIRKIEVLFRKPRLLRWFLLDFIDNHGRPAISLVLFLGSKVMKVLGQRRRFTHLLMSAHRISNGKSRIINQSILNNRQEVLRESLQCIRERSDDAQALEMALGRTIILKKPSVKNNAVVEKGVLLITFTDSCGVLFNAFDFERIGKDYYIVLEPSWAGYCLPEILVWATLSHPVIVEATEPLDHSFVDAFSDNFKPIAIGASNWVDSRYFYPLKNAKKIYDVLYVTNYNKIKRHHVFFRAIARARSKDSDLKAAMACGSAGQDRDLVYALIDYYGVNDCLDIYENLGKEELNGLLNRSRCNVLLSLKEGSNRSIFESMFAGTPVILLSKNTGVRKDYVNESTGVLCTDRSLSDDIIKMKTDGLEWNAANWAHRDIAPEASTESLLSCIRQVDGNPDWGADSGILVKVNRPEVEYRDEVDYCVDFDVPAVLDRYRH